MMTLKLVATFSLAVGIASGQAAWSAVTPANSPSGRSATPGVSDVTGMLVFGGVTAGGVRVNDLWRLDPFAAGGINWTSLTPASPLPLGRSAHAAAYDLSRGVMVVFGGRTGAGNAGISGETWEWDSFTNTWADLTPASPVYGVNTPPHLEFSTMVYDQVAGHCLMFGGRGNATTAPLETDDTWAWDGATWTKLTPLTTSPTPRRNHAMAYDPTSGTTMVWGGIAAGATLGETWLWDGSDWANIPTTTAPYATPTQNGSILNALVYDEVRNRFVLTWGTYPGGTSQSDANTFEFVNGDWLDRGPSGLTQRHQVSMAYVQAAGKTYRFGGYDYNAGGVHQNDAYEYQTTAIAAANPYGAGCTGPGGTLAYTADNLPWTGDTWTGSCTGVGASSLGLAVWGLGTVTTPLNLLLPIAGPGCDLLNSATLLTGPTAPVAGAVSVQLALPNNPVLAGFILHSQVAELEFDLSLNWTGLYSSNGLTLTVGVQ